MRYQELLETIVGTPSDILTRQCSDGSFSSFIEYRDGIMNDLVHLWESSPPEVSPWKIVSSSKVISVWKSSQRYGVVRNERALENIAKQFYHNIAALNLYTELAGHLNSSNAIDVLVHFYGLNSPDELPDQWTEQEIEDFVDWVITTPTGGWRISDYGIERLTTLACLLDDCADSEEKLLVCDAILNVTHQRSDLASWFVQGGQMTMSMISDE